MLRAVPLHSLTTSIERETNGVPSALRSRGVSIPAILITGNPTKYVRDRAAAAAVLVVEKPSLGSYLLDWVREAVAKHA